MYLNMHQRVLFQLTSQNSFLLFNCVHISSVFCSFNFRGSFFFLRMTYVIMFNWEKKRADLHQVGNSSTYCDIHPHCVGNSNANLHNLVGSFIIKAPFSLILGRSKVKFTPESGTSPRFSNLFLGLWSTFPEMLLKSVHSFLSYFGHKGQINAGLRIEKLMICCQFRIMKKNLRRIWKTIEVCLTVIPWSHWKKVKIILSWCHFFISHYFMQ